MQGDKLIHVEPPPTNAILELLKNVPASILEADYKAVIWLDALKRAAQKIK